ncbi:CoA transferase, partial [Natronoarchaeum mannanilyticum]
APVQDAADIAADPHVEAREMRVGVDQPGADAEVAIAGNPIKMIETPTKPGERAPLLDEHREELLEDAAPAEADD